MLDQFNTCDRENIIHQLLKVQAQVKVTPLVKHGIPKVHCIDSCIKPCSDCCNDEYDDFDCCNCDHDCDFTCGSDNNCDFTLTQLICVEIPISFDADVDIKKGILCCGEPHVNSDCSHYLEDDLKPDCRRHSNDINPHQIYILMNRKTQF